MGQLKTKTTGIHLFLLPVNCGEPKTTKYKKLGAQTYLVLILKKVFKNTKKRWIAIHHSHPTHTVLFHGGIIIIKSIWHLTALLHPTKFWARSGNIRTLGSMIASNNLCPRTSTSLHLYTQFCHTSFQHVQATLIVSPALNFWSRSDPTSLSTFQMGFSSQVILLQTVQVLLFYCQGLATIHDNTPDTCRNTLRTELSKSEWGTTLTYAKHKCWKRKQQQVTISPTTVRSIQFSIQHWYFIPKSYGRIH